MNTPMSQSPARQFRPALIARRRCPRCGEGAIFRALFSMNEHCPVCGLDFDRGQPGYFTGAMYVSYGMGVPTIAALTGIGHLLLPSWTLWQLVLLAWGITLPFIPWIWQFSRVIWIHFDQWADPDL